MNWHEEHIARDKERMRQFDENDKRIVASHPQFQASALNEAKAIIQRETLIGSNNIRLSGGPGIGLNRRR
jgi:hypothetical protein